MRNKLLAFVLFVAGAGTVHGQELPWVKVLGPHARRTARIGDDWRCDPIAVVGVF